MNVKICSLYGVGFYYIPGTDMCLKIGGWVRTYNIWNDNGNSTNGALALGNLENNTTNNYSWKVRGYITADARNQTPYGTVRSYIDVGLTGDYAAAFNANRAFIQWAGFTFGLAQSFYDFYSAPAVAFFGGHIQPSSDTGDGGQYVMAYTAQFGNGLSATIASEGDTNNRATTLVGQSFSTAPTAIAAPGQAYSGANVPDTVGNIRLDQAWGSAQIMGAIHRVYAQYYSGATTLGGAAHPGEAWGYALGAGLRLNAPMIGKGDYFQSQINYTEGALGYVAAGNISYGAYGPGGSYGYGYTTDGVYTNIIGSGIQLTTAWGVNASYEHNWNDQWKTSVYGGYMDVSYNATANTTLCTIMQAATFMNASRGNALCNNDWSYYDVGSRTQWNVTKDFYLGLDVIYTHLNTASGGMITNIAATSTQPNGVRTITDQDAWTVNFRVHKDFYP